MVKEESGVSEKVENGSAISFWEQKRTQFIISRIASFLPKLVAGNDKFEKTFNTEQNRYVHGKCITTIIIDSLNVYSLIRTILFHAKVS